MHVGVFIEEMRNGITQEDAFREAFALVDAVERDGLDGVWLGELHFLPARCVFSAPLVVASAMAARTRRIRIGTAVHVLPLGNPLRIAEEAATVDQISDGRFEFGIGRSGSTRVYDAFGIPYEESQSRFQEALEIIVEAFKGQPFTYKGAHYRVDNATLSPRPIQRPYPPLRMAATNEETFVQVGRMGLPIFVGLRGTEIPELAMQIRSYRAAWKAAGHAGHGDVYLRIPIYAAPAESGALDDPRESITYYFRRQADLARASLGRAGTEPIERRQAMVDRLTSLTYDRVLATKVAFGTAPQLVARLAELRDALVLNGIVVELNSGGMMPPDRVTRSLSILAHDVAPALRSSA
ncbi:MAG: LLM class flavin-dependent oxidoreductase [Candidatus Rokubacteria bacterium]|nr:LLM class flavin-dependent oxidoreductase [Candidatus Rokubacteria bacterium]